MSGLKLIDVMMLFIIMFSPGGLIVSVAKTVGETT